MTALVFLFPF